MLEECHTRLPALISNNTGTKTDIGQAKDPNMSTHNYIHLIFNKDAKIHTGEKTVSSTISTGKTRCQHLKN